MRKRVRVEKGVGHWHHSVTTTYSYDTSGQLSDFEQSGSTSTSSDYGYDASGNRNNNGETITTGNRLESSDGWTNGYDREGNLTTADKTVTTTNIYMGVTDIHEQTYHWEYVYDHRNRLLSAFETEEYKTNGTTTYGPGTKATATYAYGPFGERVASYTEEHSGGILLHSAEARSIYDGWNPMNAGGEILAELDSNNDLVSQSIRGDNNENWARYDATVGGSDSHVKWFFADHQGSIREVTDDAGVPKVNFAYDPYGNITQETAASGVSDLDDYAGRYRWQGMGFERATGLLSNGPQWYDPKVGRWIGESQFGPNAGDSNLYRYVRNAPMNYTDHRTTGFVPVSFQGTTVVPEKKARNLNEQMPPTVQAAGFVGPYPGIARGGFFWSKQQQVQNLPKARSFYIQEMQRFRLVGKAWVQTQHFFEGWPVAGRDGNNVGVAEVNKHFVNTNVALAEWMQRNGIGKFPKADTAKIGGATDIFTSDSSNLPQGGVKMVGTAFSVQSLPGKDGLSTAGFYQIFKPKGAAGAGFQFSFEASDQRKMEAYNQWKAQRKTSSNLLVSTIESTWEPKQSPINNALKTFNRYSWSTASFSISSSLFQQGLQPPIHVDILKNGTGTSEFYTP